MKLKRVPLAKIASPAMRAASLARVGRWNRRALDPKKYQLQHLMSHLKAAADTEFGREHGFAKIKSYEDFKRQVPLRTYADFEPYIERMRRGERNVLWPGLISYYGKSSGSSSTAAKNKYLPVSMTQIRWQQRSMFDLISRYHDISGGRNFAGGYSLALLPPATLEEESPGVFVGSNPGIMLRHIPAIARAMAIPKPPIRDIADYDQKLTRIAEEYIDYDVRSLSGTTCWFSVFFDRLLAVANERGRNVTTVGELWPNLQVLFGGGVHAGPYRKIIRERVGHDVTLIDNYNATEGGIFAVTDRRDDDSMLMVPDRGVFYEFVPREEHGRPDATRYPLWEVKPGVDYSVVLTNSSGLMGYYIGDFIRFTSVLPHRMEFAGRASGVLSLTQELTSYIEIEKAFTAAAEKHDCVAQDYTATSEVGVEGQGKGRYVLFVEFNRSPSDLDQFISSFDSELSQENRVYREHREGNVAILPPRLVVMPRGTTRKFMELIGQTSVQNKFPRIIDEKKRDLLRSLLPEEGKKSN